MGNERKGLLGVIVGAVVSLCRGAKTRVRMGSKPSEKFLVWVGFYRGFVLYPLLFAVPVDVVSEDAGERLIDKI